MWKRFYPYIVACLLTTAVAVWVALVIQSRQLSYERGITLCMQVKPQFSRLQCEYEVKYLSRGE